MNDDVVDLLFEPKNRQALKKSILSGRAILEEAVDKLNESHAIVMVDGRCRVLNEVQNPSTHRPDISFSTIHSFTTRYANRTVGNKGIAAYWLKHQKRREYKGIVFAPLEEAQGYYNLWKGFAVEPKKGDCSLYLRHIRENIADNDEGLYTYIIAWMADIIQNPGNRKGIVLVLRGEQGIGKEIVCSEFGRLLGHHFTPIKTGLEISSTVNPLLKDTLLVFAHNTCWEGRSTANGILQRIITEPYLNIKLKGGGLYQVKNHIHLMIAAHREWAVPAGLDERCFCTIDAPPKATNDKGYFKHIAHQMDHGGREALLYFLMNFDLARIDLQAHTHATLKQKISSMTPARKFLFYMLWAGTQLRKSDEWITEPIPKKRLQDEYFKFVEKANIYFPGNINVLGLELHKCIPAIRALKRTGADGKRYRAYQFPSLQKCREHFEKTLNTTFQWPDEGTAHEDPKDILPGLEGYSL